MAIYKIPPTSYSISSWRIPQIVDNTGHSSTVICSNCGEELIGAVNRCWKCGTKFVRTVQSVAAISPQDPVAVAPPIRRAPVLADYLHQDAAPDSQAVMAVIIEDEEEPTEETESPLVETAQPGWVERGRMLLEMVPVDWPAVGGSILAIVSCWFSYLSIFGAVIGFGVVALNVYLLKSRRTFERKVGFCLAIAAMLCALSQLVSSLYFWSSGTHLSTTLFG